TIVFYTGERKWKGNHSLKDMMEEIPKELEQYFNDYKMILVDIKELDATKISDKETREMIQIVQSIYNVERKQPEKIKLTKDAALTAGMITGSKWLIEEAEKCKEGINVCEAMDRYVEKKKAEEKRDMLITLLTTKLGNLSKQVVEKRVCQ
ncbi:MAG: Rpn family recombination-promoting nuclease/putative transposase, partial [Solobacterium sp.]|nr:Rpn family recombination-promoting nuclease/putative transposase [Solobacterium sp.]